MSTERELDPAERFAQAWDEFVLAIRRVQARGLPIGDDLTLAQYYALLALAREGNMSVSTLAEEAGIAAPTATRLIDGLERAGLVRRERSTRDRRNVHVSLTDSGRERFLRKQRELARRRRQLYDRLDPQERTQSEHLLLHLAQIVGEL